MEGELKRNERPQKSNEARACVALNLDFLRVNETGPGSQRGQHEVRR